METVWSVALLPGEREWGDVDVTAPRMTVVIVAATVLCDRGQPALPELKPGTRLGSFRDGGLCGPGYNVYTAHVLAPEG